MKFFFQTASILFIGLLSSCAAQKEVQQEDYVAKSDVFWGSGKKDLSRKVVKTYAKSNLEKKWSSPKPAQGNLHPGAVLPFHLVSVSPYGDGYPTGYNPKIFKGFTHFHQSGTGYILWFYNYVLIQPVLNDSITVFHIEKENAELGYYSVKTKEGIEAQASVYNYVSYTKYSFPKSSNAELNIDLAHVYKAPNNGIGFPSNITWKFSSDSSLHASIIMDGIPIFLAIQMDRAISESSIELKGHVEIGAERVWKQRDASDSWVWNAKFENTNEVSVKTAFSLNSFEEAESRLTNSVDLDLARKQSKKEWNTNLSKIQLKGITPEIDSLFYSALAKSLIKPIYAPLDHPFNDATAYFTDFATWWDSYQTQMPLLNLLYPKMSESMLDYLIESASRFDYWRTADLFSSQAITGFDNQGTAIAPIAIASIWMRLGNDYRTEELLEIMQKNLKHASVDLSSDPTRIKGSEALQFVDVSYASYLASNLAKSVNNKNLAESMKTDAGLWPKAYNPKTGLLYGQEFYEAGPWNYSFKPWWDVQGFADFQGGKNKLEQKLDTFFGFSETKANLHFEGLNNEVDMSVPYWYTLLGKPEKTQDIIRTLFSNRFGLGRGGLPGNEDSGALSSWLVWNILGLYPHPTKDAYLIGSPFIQSAKITLDSSEIEIIVSGNEDEKCSVDKIFWNSKPILDFMIDGKDFRKGGKLEISMKSVADKSLKK